MRTCVVTLIRARGAAPRRRTRCAVAAAAAASESNALVAADVADGSGGSSWMVKVPSAAGAGSASIAASSSITSLAVCGRSSGLFAKRRMISRDNRFGVVAVIWCGGVGSCVASAIKMPMVVSLWNGSSPVQRTYRTQPRLNRSVRASTCLSPRACSGDMKAGVPMMAPDWVICTSSACMRARPKSRMIARRGPERGVSSQMFAGLMSRWTSPASWATRNPCAISLPMRTTSSIGKRTPCFKGASSGSPFKSGIAINGTPLSSPTR